jgi:hypothetical protein
LCERLSVAEVDAGAHLVRSNQALYRHDQGAGRRLRRQAVRQLRDDLRRDPHLSLFRRGTRADGEKGPLGKPKSDKSWKCSASLAFEGGKLARVSFAPRDVVSPYEKKKDPKTGEKVYVTPPEPCTFSLPNCAR